MNLQAAEPDWDGSAEDYPDPDEDWGMHFVWVRDCERLAGNVYAAQEQVCIDVALCKPCLTTA